METLMSKLIELGWTGEMSLYGIFIILTIIFIYTTIEIVKSIKRIKQKTTVNTFGNNVVKGDKVSIREISNELNITGTVMKAIKGQDTVRVTVEVKREMIYPIDDK